MVFYEGGRSAMCHTLLFLSELWCKIGCSEHCFEEQCNLSKRLIGEGESYKQVQQIIGFSSKLISNAWKWQQKPGACRKIKVVTIYNGSSISPNAKYPAKHHFQTDTRWSKMTCKYHNSQKTFEGRSFVSKMPLRQVCFHKALAKEHINRNAHEMCFNKALVPNTQVIKQHIGFRQKVLRWWSGQLNPPSQPNWERLRSH